MSLLSSAPPLLGLIYLLGDYCQNVLQCEAHINLQQDGSLVPFIHA